MTETPHQTNQQPRGLWAKWEGVPLYLRIVFALLVGVITGLMLQEQAAILALPGKLILRILGALAPPLILLAVIHALMTAEIKGRMAGKLVRLLMLNTLVAIGIGLVVANIIGPGRGRDILLPTATEKNSETQNLIVQFLDNIPQSLLGPLGNDGKVVSVILIAVAFGVALRRFRDTPVRTPEEAVRTALQTLIVVLTWVIEIVPIAVFGVVASIVGTQGFAAFAALGMFVVAVILALVLQTAYYLVRVRLGSWVRPLDLLRGTRDALVMAFSTASSTITMPVTYERLRQRVGVSERSAGMGALVGANFNNDGTALYEAMSALFVSQLLDKQLSLWQQFLVVVTSVIASVGAAGIPEAGLVTMTLVFTAVGLPTEYIAVLLTVDWFLDRCRTTVNVLGDLNVSCLLDGKERPVEGESELAAV